VDLTAEDNFFVERLMPPARRVPNCCAPPGSPAPSAPADWHSPGRHAAAPPPRSSPPARPQRPRVQPRRRDRRACRRRSGFRSAAARVAGVIAFFTTAPREPAPVLWPRWPRWRRLGAPSPVGSQAPRFPPTRLARWTSNRSAAWADPVHPVPRHDLYPYELPIGGSLSSVAVAMRQMRASPVGGQRRLLGTTRERGVGPGVDERNPRSMRARGGYEGGRRELVRSGRPTPGTRRRSLAARKEE
jgi:hypothetical protein